MSETDQKEYKVGTLPNLPVIIHAQYFKDISFENPHAPNSLRAGRTDKPQIDLNILLDAKNIDDPEIKSLYEVVMTVRGESKRGGQTDFIIEVTYAAAVSLRDIEADKHHPLLFVEIPRQIFPYVRQCIAQITQGGGYVPLFLNPIDFQAMYVSRFGKDAPEGNA